MAGVFTGKSLFASKTFWANVITTLIAVLGVAAGQEWIKDHPQLTAAIGAAVGLLNIALRYVTKLPIAAWLLWLVPIVALGGAVQLHTLDAQQPTPAPPLVPVVIPTPDAVAQPIVKITAPTRVSGAFLIMIRTDAAAKVTWRNDLPAGAQPPIEMHLKDEVTGTGDSARTYAVTALFFQEVVSGPYLFRGRAQIESPGLDPVDDFERLTIVGNVPPPEPPTPPGPPKPPTPPPTPVDDPWQVGQTAFSLVSALSAEAKSKAKPTAALYRQAADGLENATYPTVTEAAKWLQTERTKAWGSAAAEWATAQASLGEIWTANWPLTKEQVIKFYRAVAAGLEGVQ